MRTYISLFSSAWVWCYWFKENWFECILTSELIKSRLDIQKYNNKCKYDSWYIWWDITKKDVQEKVFSEIEFRQKNEWISDVDVIIATPPCQWMSTANYKKNNEQWRNSLVVEAIKIIKKVNPKIFVFENVRAFISTICTDIDWKDIEIWEAILKNLWKDYNIEYRVINFKDYWVPSSRPRTLVIWTRKDQDYMSPFNLFPLPEKQIPLKESIWDLKPLKEPWDFDKKDVYHFFRVYDNYMREWIHDLKEWESAFDNPDWKKPYKIVDWKKEILKSWHLGNKFRRLIWNKPCACVATRSDQLAAMDTIHPSDDRVLSIREIMRVMSIPEEFKWVKEDVHSKEILDNRVDFLKQNELNIRRCVWEAVPTKIMYKIAKNINDMLDFNDYIESKALKKDNLYIRSYINEYNQSTEEARENGSFYTSQSVIYDCLKNIEDKNRDIVRILEPSVWWGNFIIPIISKFYNSKKIIIDIVDINDNVLKDTMSQLQKYWLDPKKVEINVYNMDFLDFDIKYEYDYIIGNPPYFKVESWKKKEYKKKINFKCDNIFWIFLEKIYGKSKNIIMVIPKNFLMTPEFNSLRAKYENYNIVSITDYWVYAFKKVFIEIIVIHFTKDKCQNTIIDNVRDWEKRLVPQKFIFDDKSRLIYKDKFFIEYKKRLKLGVFDFFRDRQITNKFLLSFGKYWVLKSKNILDNGSIKHIQWYDKYINDINNFTCSKYMNKKVIIMPNFTYNTRATFMPKNVIVNGSIAILFPKNKSFDIDDLDLWVYSTEEFRKYYSIVKNNSKFTLNIDNNSLYYIGIIRNA